LGQSFSDAFPVVQTILGCWPFDVVVGHINADHHPVDQGGSSFTYVD